MWRTKGGRGSLKCQVPLITADVCRPPLEKIGGGGGTLFTGEFCPRGTLFTGELCPGGQYSPVNNVRGDILRGDSVHYDTVPFTGNAASS